MISKQIIRELNHLRYASQLSKISIDLKSSKFLYEILQWLFIRGFIHAFETIYKSVNGSKYSFKVFRVFLKYLPTSRGLLDHLTIPGHNFNDHKFNIFKQKKYQNCIILLTTSYGLRTISEARRLNIGGSIILKIFI